MIQPSAKKDLTWAYMDYIPLPPMMDLSVKEDPILENHLSSGR